MGTKKESSDQTFGIGAVSRLTGLTDHTIRVWERRYRAVTARRAANGRRRYTAADVDKLSLLKLLTDSGLSIGRIAAEPVESLRARAEQIDRLASDALPPGIRVAVLGDFLPARLRSAADELEPLEIVVADAREERFLADAGSRDVDVLVLELPALDDDTPARLRRCLDRTGAKNAIVVYGFGRRADVERIRDAGAVLLRSPVTPDEIVTAVGRARQGSAAGRRRRAGRHAGTKAESWIMEGPVEPRRFTPEQLAALSGVATDVECECPQQLAQLVADLSAFEIYSANCANRNEEDAALHRYLHRTTARARALIEAALKRVADAEGLRY